MVQAYSVDPSAAHENFWGQDLCLNGIATPIDARPSQVAETVSAAPEVGVLLHHSEEKERENYRKLMERTELGKEGDILRVWCSFMGFEPVQGAPEPMVGPPYLPTVISPTDRPRSDINYA